MPSLRLTGCAPVPLAHYLKALGILRLVAEQRDPEAAGCWEKDSFILHSSLDQQRLMDFLLNDYRPTPILAPWNGGSGFMDGPNEPLLACIAKSTAYRFKHYHEGITSAFRLMDNLNLSEVASRIRKAQHERKKAKKEKNRKAEKEWDERYQRAKAEFQQAKPSLLTVCRNHLPEPVIQWLDAAYVLTSRGEEYPPLLGTGGNDGKLDFSYNFMQRLTEVIDPSTGQPRASAGPLLEAALFGTPKPLPLSRAPIGQFAPGNAGGANATTGFNAESVVNPWDFILMLEGALLFAAAAVRRLETAEPGALAYPFCVRQVGSGYASAAAGDEVQSRAEMWMPLWNRPTTLGELATILSEGRAQVGYRRARNGVDFARAIVSLGVDRGLSEFQRFGFQVRNGLAYFATPLGRFAVRRNARADLLSEVDGWLDTLRQIAGPNAKQVPASVASALRQLEDRIFDLCQEGSPSRLQAVLIGLARAEAALAQSHSWTTNRTEGRSFPKIRPLSGLSGRWLRETYDGSVEFRLAASLASITGRYKDREGRPLPVPFRRHLEPVAMKGSSQRHWTDWDDPSSPDLVWREGEFIRALNAVLARRLTRAVQAALPCLPDRGLPARLADVVAFIEGDVDDSLLTELVWALALLDWPSINWTDDAPWRQQLFSDQDESVTPSALFSLMRLAFPRELEAAAHGVIP
ncbi:type I-G CRISPR-associated protein Cas8g1/Csx17, partial [Limisphaera sp. 4302-co]|uniref:type I-G CRISPR-associated protein Cas8g1/Csx17 n=1 Tax=Limisphaera sp. 4302-co TaxID=3400417 RepID=UPI003C298115